MLWSKFHNAHDLNSTPLKSIDNCIRLMRFSARIKSLNIVTCILFRRDRMRSKFSQYNERTSVRMSYNILCSCENDIWFLKAVRRIASIFACVLLKVFHKITQRFTIIVQFISFNVHFFATSINTLYKHFCFRPKLTLDAAALIPPRSLLILIFTPYLCIYINRYIYISLCLARCNAWTHERCRFNCMRVPLIVWSPDHTQYLIALFYNTCFHCTTIAYRSKIYRKI